MPSHVRKWSLSSIIVLFGTIALLVSACGGSGSSNSGGSAAPDSQQVLHDVLVPGSNDIATMDPGLVQDAYSIVPINLVFPPLVTLDSKLNVVPWAATAAPTVSSDGLTYTFSIRSGLKFSDGEPIDAAAFAYAMNRSLDPCTASPVAYYLFSIKDATTFNGESCKNGTDSGSIPTLIGDSIVVKDPQTLVVTLQQPAAYFLAAMTYPTSYAVPKNLITQYGTKWIDHLADGSGFGGNLFKVTKWDHNGALVLDRNSAYWGTAPKLREIQYTIYKSLETQYNAYLAGQNDRGIPPSTQYPTAKTKPDFHETGVLQIDYYAMNWQNAPFDDVRIRQAFSLAVDRQALATAVLHGTVIPSYHIVPSGMPGHNPGLKLSDGTQNLTGNPTMATQLEQQYVQQKCGGNAATCPPVTLTITTGSQDIQNEAEAALAMWQKAFPGYPIKIATTDFNTLLNDLAARKVQFWAIAWIADYPDPQDWLSLQFLPTAQYNDGNVNVPDANTLMTKADAESDQTQRMKDYNAAEQLLVTQVAWMSTDQAKNFYEVRSYVNGYTEDAQGNVPLPQWQSLYIASH